MIDETLTDTTPSANSVFTAGQVAISCRYEISKANLPPVLLEKLPSVLIPATINQWSEVAVLKDEDVILNVVDAGAKYRFRAMRDFDGSIHVSAIQ